MDAVGAFAEDAAGPTSGWRRGASGLDRFDPRTGKFDHVVANPEDPNSLSSDLVLALSIDAQGQVWAATLGGGLNRYDPAIPQVKRYMHDELNPQSLIGDNVVSHFTRRRRRPVAGHVRAAWIISISRARRSRTI